MPIKSMLSPEVKAVLNKAVHSELQQSHLWKHIANQLQRLGYFGAQKYFAKESAEELEHYQILADYMNDMGEVASVPALSPATARIGSLRDALELAYKTEADVLEMYADAYRAMDDDEGADDPVTRQFLLQFLEIQRKAIGAYGDLISRLDRTNDDECGILLIDQEMGE